MDELTVIAVLAASLLHASWHALIKSTEDPLVSLGSMSVVSAGTALALLPLTKPLPVAAYLIIAGSVVLHFSYKVTLALLYRHADLGQAFPLARGLTPIMAATLAFLTMGEVPDPSVMAGIGLICSGIALLAFEGRGRGLSLFTAGAALATGLAVAAYSVVDAYGVRMSRDVFSFSVWLVLVDGCVFVAYTAATRRAQVIQSWKLRWRRILVSGWFGVISFGVFMWALGRAPVGAVSALRETSVLFAAIIGAVVLGERATWMRFAAAALVAAGVGVIALAR